MARHFDLVSPAAHLQRQRESDAHDEPLLASLASMDQTVDMSSASASSVVPFSVRELDHLVLRTARLEALIAFYQGVLGCALERRVAELGLVQLRAGRSLVDLVDVAGELGRAGGAAPGIEGRNLDHLCLRIEPFDPEAIAAHLEQAGAPCDAPARRYGAQGYGPSVYTRDPDGNVVELRGPGRPSEVRSGSR
jgi:catechol 2,3-dioxygenase-like lactoylglutathione lyase family enzyme